jgi:hypothetical protein
MDVLLKKFDSSGISPLAIKAAPWVGEEVIAATLSALESFPVSSSVGGLAMMGSWECPSAMERRMGSVIASSWKKLKVAGKMRRQEREAMGWDVLSGTDFIGITSNSMMIRFPRKRCLSISTTYAIRMRSRAAKRWGV